MGNAESSLRNFGRRVDYVHQSEPIPFNLSSMGNARRSNVCSPHQVSRSFSVGDSLDFRSSAVVAPDTSDSQSQSHVMHMPGFSGNVHPFPCNGASNSRAGVSSSFINLSGERGIVLREEASLISIPRNSGERVVFVPASEMRNLAQDPTNWSLATRNLSTPGVVSSTSRIGSSSSGFPSPTPAWVPHYITLSQNPHRLSGFDPWTLFPVVDSESGGQSGHIPPLPASGPPTPPQETTMSFGTNIQGNHQPFPRSAFLMERQGDDIFGMPHTVRAIATNIEGRHILISEIC